MLKSDLNIKNFAALCPWIFSAHITSFWDPFSLCHTTKFFVGFKKRIIWTLLNLDWLTYFWRLTTLIGCLKKSNSLQALIYKYNTLKWLLRNIRYIQKIIEQFPTNCFVYKPFDSYLLLDISWFSLTMPELFLLLTLIKLTKFITKTFSVRNLSFTYFCQRFITLFYM